VSGPVETLAAAALLVRTSEFAEVGMFDERATIYWEEQEIARKFRRRGQHAYYRADAFVYHRWRKGGGEHDSQPVTTAYFDEGMRLYYAQTYGVAGRVLFDALRGLGALLSLLRRRASPRRARA
jgi:GT2 family glycosyltransferase